MSNTINNFYSIELVKPDIEIRIFGIPGPKTF